MRSIVAFLFAAPMVAMVAQASETGDIRGQVVDPDGLPVPGASIVLSGSDLGGERTATTNEEGRFRFVDLLSGTYRMVVSFDGIVVAEAEVMVRQQATTNVPLTVDLANAKGEEIVVVYIQPVIDTTSSAFSTNLSEGQIQNLPVGRSYQDVVNMLPGVDGRIDTSAGGPGDGNASVRGEGQYGNGYTLDGVQTRDPATKTFGQSVNFDAIEGIQVYTDGAPAEFGRFTGMLVNVVTKDGGDEHHGSAAIFYSQHAWAKPQYDIFDPGTATEVPTDKQRFRIPNLSLTAGGPIVKEKLWYFLAVDAGYSYYQGEGVDAEAAQKTWSGTVLAKLTWFPRYDVTARLLYTHDFGIQANSEASQLISPAAQTDRKDQSFSILQTTEWRPDNVSSLTARIGFTQIGIDVVPSSGDRDAPNLTNSAGLELNNAKDFDLNTRRRVGGGLEYSHLFEQAAGTHKFKMGAEYWYLQQTRDLFHTGATTVDWINQNGEATGDTYDVGTEYSANPDLGYDCNSPDGGDCGYRTHWLNAGPLGTTSHTFSAFVQDDWAPVPQFTFNLGVRLDVEAGRNDAGNPPTTQDIQEFSKDPADRVIGSLGALVMPAPRLGFAWDITNDAKTKLSGNYGWYYDLQGADYWEWANERSAAGYSRYARDEAGAWVWTNTQDSEGAPLIYANNLRPARLDKVTVAIEREIVPLLSIGLRGMMSWTRGIPEDVDVNLDDFYIMNSPIKQRQYRGLEVTLERKFDGVWQLLGSYTLSESVGHAPGQFELASGADAGSNGNNVGVYLDDVGEESARRDFYDSGSGWILEGFKGLGRYSVTDPDFKDDAGYFGYLPYHSFHRVKLNASYTMPWGTTLGLVYEFDSGHAWQKRTFVSFYGYDGLGQGRGTRFMPAVHYVDVRIAHKFSFRKEQSLELSLDIFNLPGLFQAITYYENDAAGFGLVLNRQAPRSIRGGIKYRW